MPPKKRGRPPQSSSNDATATTTTEDTGSRTTKRPRLDTKKETNTTDQSTRSDVLSSVLKKVTEIVERSDFKSKNEQIKLTIILSTADVSLFRDEITQELKHIAPSVSVDISEAVFGVLDRHVTFQSSSFVELIKAIFYSVYTIQHTMNLRHWDEKSIYFINSTVDRQHYVNLAKDKRSELMKLKTVNISSTVIPGTLNRLSCRYCGLIEDIIPALVLLNPFHCPTSNISLDQTPMFSPFTATSAFKRTSKNQTLLIQSSQTYNKYINNEHILSAKIHEKNPKALSLIAIEQAKLQTARCEPTQTTKQVVRFPLDCLPKLTVNNGARLSDIRGKSNANVIVGEDVVDLDYKEVSVQGIPEGVIFVLDIFFHIINKFLHPELARRRRFKRG
ncbi:hypothetical protein WICPIJ_001615 [Wickerhamomyces pijperi]|uniref:Uncharacterized protein n=1 Tax=Wickerhamomyces pijperi TaxID=599730 RepID=A0A9P8QD63_WICPI|nr:hypothetical protein WICPIJ_001615 [Wickerhamomyces pijperi]